MVSGKLVIDSKKRLRVEFRLWDVIGGKEIEGLALFATPKVGEEFLILFLIKFMNE
jgi:TolB protein